MTTEFSTEDFREQRQRMVDSQLRTGGVVDLDVLAAFLDVARERFVAPAQSRFAYLDRETPALGASSRKLLPPLTLARLLQAASLNAGDRALDVGGGSGCGAALLSSMGAKVVALESDPGAVAAARNALAGDESVEITEGSLAAGAPSKAPFDVIVVHGGFEVPPTTLLEQLADGGRLVGVDCSRRAGEAVLYEKKGGAVGQRALFETRAPILDGFARAASFVF
jgi:protein-L-isoaspartate(D-aspartate) O-methyltransferase